MTIQEQLLALAHDVLIVEESVPGTFSLDLPPDFNDGVVPIEVSDTVTTVMEEGPIDLTLIAKNVRFEEVPIEDEDFVGGMPIVAPSATGGLPAGLGNVMEGNDGTPPGVPGIIGRLQGTIPIPVQRTLDEKTEATLEVRWTITDGSGHTVADASWTLGTESGVGGLIEADGAKAALDLAVELAVSFVELTTASAPTVTRRIGARVRLSAAGTSSGWVDVPPVEVLVPPISVPTLLVLCEDKDFEAAKLIVVPSASPLEAETLAPALQLLRDSINAVSGLASTLSLFLSHVDSVASLVQQGQIAFRRASSIDNFNDIDLYSGFWNDTEAEDELSSAIMVGPPDRVAQLYNAREQSSHEGRMDLVVDSDLIVRVADLHSDSPSSEPAGRVIVHEDGLGDLTHADHFGDELSSMRFAWS